jgi:hypothetical protein
VRGVGKDQRMVGSEGLSGLLHKVDLGQGNFNDECDD